MHDTAYEHARLFFELYGSEAFGTIVELGSQDVNGTLRDHCPPGACYIGLDMLSAKGVDVVVDPTRTLPIASDSIDTVVTSSAFEHDACFWDTFMELVRILRPGGLLYVNAPSDGDFHRHPVDCWRFFPDAGVALVQWAGRRGIDVELVESFIGLPKQERWSDFVAVFRKPGETKLMRRGRIADHAAGINIHDCSTRVGGRLEAESATMPAPAITADLRTRLGAREVDLSTARDRNETLSAALSAAQAEASTARADASAAQADASAAQADASAAHIQIAALRADLRAAEQKIGGLANALTDATENLAAIRASRSWRMTAGLRVLGRIVQGR